MAKKYQKVVNYKTGYVFDNDGEQIESQEEAWRESAKCGCGIDCCEHEFVNRDKTTGEKYTLYVDDGTLYVKIGETTHEVSFV